VQFFILAPLPSSLKTTVVPIAPYGGDYPPGVTAFEVGPETDCFRASLRLAARWAMACVDQLGVHHDPCEEVVEEGGAIAVCYETPWGGTLRLLELATGRSAILQHNG
jgi:hypothetical protein